MCVRKGAWGLILHAKRIGNPKVQKSVSLRCGPLQSFGDEKTSETSFTESSGAAMITKTPPGGGGKWEPGFELGIRFLRPRTQGLGKGLGSSRVSNLIHYTKPERKNLKEGGKKIQAGGCR